METLHLLAALFLFGQICSINGGFGGGPPTQSYGSYGNAESAGNSAVSEINANENVARWSAQSAVASAVGRDYASQLGTTAQFASQFTAPVTKSQTNQAFNAVRHQQEGSLISAALANAGPAIQHASQTASKSNFDQAYAAAEGSRLSGNAASQHSHEMILLAGSALASQQLQSQQAAHYEDAQKTQQTRTNANALQAIQNINSVDRGASYGR